MKTFRRRHGLKNLRELTVFDFENQKHWLEYVNHILVYKIFMSYNEYSSHLFQLSIEEVSEYYFVSKKFLQRYNKHIQLIPEVVHKSDVDKKVSISKKKITNKKIYNII